MPLVAGVDSSTQSTKVEVRDLDTGALVASGRAPHPSTAPPISEQHPHDWWSAFEAAWAAAGAPGVAAIAVGAQQHGLVVLDADGAVVRPAKLWNDTTSAPDAEWLLGRLDGGAAAWAAATGLVPVASFTITKLSWLRRVEPERFRRLARVLLPHDWLTHRLTGGFTTDRGDASGTGYWSAADDCYRFELLSLVDDTVDWAEAVPTVLGPTDRAGTWQGAVVGPGTGDNMAAALGVALGPGDVAMSIGTSGTVYAVSSDPVADPSGTVAGFADGTGNHLPLVATLNAAKVTDWLATLLRCAPAELADLALTAEAGSGGTVLVPHLDGERTPNRPAATGAFTGLRTATTRADLARAAHEGVVCNLLDALDALRAVASGPTRRVLLVGGGSRSPAYRQVVADLLGQPVVVPAAAELVAAGACVQAAAVLSGDRPTDVATAWGLAGGAVVEPQLDPDRATEVRAAYAAALS